MHFPSNGHLTAKAINDKLNIETDQKNLQKLLSNLSFIDSKSVNRKKYYFLKNSIPEQSELFGS